MLNRIIQGLLSTVILASVIPPALAAPNKVIDALGETPVSLLTYGLNNLRADLREAFTGPLPILSPTSVPDEPIATTTSVFYDPESGTITLNLVKVERQPESTSPEQACEDAMVALRNFASLDPATAQPLEGTTSSALAYYFAPDGTRLASETTFAQIDELFRLQYSGLVGQERFTCSAKLLDMRYEMVRK